MTAGSGFAPSLRLDMPEKRAFASQDEAAVIARALDLVRRFGCDVHLLPFLPQSVPVEVEVAFSGILVLPLHRGEDVPFHRIGRQLLSRPVRTHQDGRCLLTCLLPRQRHLEFSKLDMADRTDSRVWTISAGNEAPHRSSVPTQAGYVC